MGTRIAPVALVVAAWLGLAGSAVAQPMDQYGIGSRGVAMGGAVTADVDDFSANYYNPAGIARTGAMRIAVGYFGVHNDLEINGRDSSIDPARGLVAGFIVPGEFGDVGVAFGFTLHLNDERVSRSRTLPRSLPRWEFYDNRPQRTYLAAHFGLRPFDWLFLGGGIGFQSTSTNDLKLRGSIDFGNPEAASRLEQQLVGELNTIRYPQVGAQVTPADWLSLGLVYRGEFALSNELSAEGLADITGLGDVPPEVFVLIRTAAVNAFVPQQLSFGASVEPTDWLRVNAELTWVDWSDYEAPLGASDVVLTVDLPPDLAGLIDVPDSINSTRAIDPEFEDRLVPRLGVELTPVRTDALELRTRAGYFYESTPAPAPTARTHNLMDTDRHAFSAGVGVKLTDLEPTVSGFWTIDTHFQFSYLPERVVHKESLVDLYGDYRGSGWFIAAGITTEVAFE